MRGSLGLSAYLTLSARRAAPRFKPTRARPDGDLVWIHAAEPGNNRAVNDLAHRLTYMQPGCQIVLTAEHDAFGYRGSPDIWQETAPADHPVVADAFMAHWEPDVVVWTWGDLKPNLILSAARTSAYMILTDAAREGFEGRRDRWLPEVPRALLSRFHHVCARDEQSQHRLVHMGCPQAHITNSPPLYPFGRMLPAAESDLTDLSEALGGRPTWLAARAVKLECTQVLAAHSLALKSSHRLLLILLVAADASAEGARVSAEKMGLRVTDWRDGTLPDENTQVLIAEDEDELGLWMRVATVTFLGGSMHPGPDVTDPFSAAAHGTAIVYGPNVGPHVDAFTDLMNAGAARIVNDTNSLGRAVTQMIAPDHAAQMAMAGWDVVTRGADSLDRVIALIRKRLNAKAQGAAL
ncbi:MAG: 3-deoxy-D-manno-octulosonic acid transferase [Tateyamaria sp.]